MHRLERSWHVPPVGCIPTRRGCRRARIPTHARRLRSSAFDGGSGARLRHGCVVEGRGRRPDDRRRRSLFERTRRVRPRQGRVHSPNTIAIEGGEDVAFKSAVVATGSYPMRHRSRASTPGAGRLGGFSRRPRCRPAWSCSAEIMVRVRLNLQPLRHRGDGHRDAAAPHPDRGRGRVQGAREGLPKA